MKTIFLLIEETGEMDDYTYSPIEAYTDKEQIEELVNEKNALVEKVKEECPLEKFQRDEENGVFDGVKYKEFMALEDKAYKEAEKLWSTYGINVYNIPTYSIKEINLIK